MTFKKKQVETIGAWAGGGSLPMAAQRARVAGVTEAIQSRESRAEASPVFWPVEFLSLEDQLAMPYELARLLPVGHYARKNLAYLAAIQQGATCIYETDGISSGRWQVA